MASVASSQQSFLANALAPPTHKPKTKILTSAANTTISCKRSYSSTDDHKGSSSDDGLLRKNENKLAKLAMVTLAAGVLTLGPVHDASAAKTGGRVGARPSGLRLLLGLHPLGSTIIQGIKKTNIYINPPVAPPLVGGYGYGYGVPFFGGWGPSVAVGIGGGFQLLAFFAFLGAVAAVARRFTGSRDEEDDDDYY
ncbi:hypothetical protein Prudu_000683 [Prunus dulcis]|uniref:Transmembrane protein n=1 Tax=Prunus dulcis TaxID=3755 RepID=A0A4Y1QLX5_PRUDU|nr:hypothetical protein Prudu_000683 [Prunus dulcis]